jgi:outer membrane protein TolC
VTLQAQASTQRNDFSRNSGLAFESEDNLSISGNFRFPLYNGGSTYSNIRQAKQVASQRQIQILESGRSVREAVTASWSFVVESQAEIEAAKAQVAAASLALEGVKQEALVGSRTTLDVLDAEQDVTEARISLVSAERDLIVAAYQVLGSIGNLNARQLGLRVRYYDPEVNYKRVRDKWWGADIGGEGDPSK